MPQLQCGRGHLKGLRNRQYLINFKEQFAAATENKVKLLIAFITAKEKTNFKFAKQL